MNNSTIFQFFHWYYPSDGALWNTCAKQATFLATLGIDYVWLPPAYKSAYGKEEPGYAVYDLFDLGEFDQKGTVATRYGTKEEYINCIKALHASGIKVLADVVLNHRLGADQQESIAVKKVNPDNRNEFVSEAETIESHTLFTFPGREKKYSDFVWDHHAFTGVDAVEGEEKVIYTIQNEYGESWEELMEEEKGNFDFLMGADVEFRNPHVREELKKWGEWYLDVTHVDGFRLDAVKHITPAFYKEWLDAMKAHVGSPFLCIAEYWSKNSAVLAQYIELMEGRTQLFDVPLHYNFYKASLEKSAYDMRQIFDNTLVTQKPEYSITFVENHDTQPLQALESTVDYWFKPHANAIILLRMQGIPCIFYPSLYGAEYSNPNNEQHPINMLPVPSLEAMIKVRRYEAYGQQRDYFDDASIVGWTREGDDEHTFSGCAVMLSNSGQGEKRMEMGQRHSGKIFVDVTGSISGEITIGKDGWGVFRVNEESISVWISKEAINR